MTMQNLVDASPVLRKIAGQELSLRTLYRVQRLFDKLEYNLRFYDSQRAEIVRECCEEKDGRLVPHPGKEAEMNRRFRELLEFEVDIGNIDPVVIPAVENVRLSYNDLQAVREFVRIGKE